MEFAHLTKWGYFKNHKKLNFPIFSHTLKEVMGFLLMMVNEGEFELPSRASIASSEMKRNDFSR